MPSLAFLSLSLSLSLSPRFITSLVIRNLTLLSVLTCKYAIMKQVTLFASPELYFHPNKATLQLHTYIITIKVAKQSNQKVHDACYFGIVKIEFVISKNCPSDVNYFTQSYLRVKPSE